MTEQEMTKEQAHNILANVCAQFRGTKQEHVMIEQSLILLKPKEDPSEDS